MTTLQVLAVVAVVVLVAVVVALLLKQRRRSRLRDTFGPEYERTVERADGRRDAERELAERAERREKLDIRPLPRADRLQYADRWRDTQEAFVDRPALAVRQADVLVAEVMSQRGYPVGDFDQQVRDVSVDHGHVVEEYRAAHEISQRNERGEASTEELRMAMVHYRTLFTDLLSDSDEVDPYAADGDAREHRDQRSR
jgi:hypothetical protein